MFSRNLVFVAAVAILSTGPTFAADPRKPPARPRNRQQPIRIQIQMNGIAVVGPAGNSKEQEAERSDSAAGLVLADRRMQAKLSRAEKLIDEKRYADALPFLQSLLESPQDAAVPDDASDRSLLKSIKLEAQRLIGRLPEAGRKMYEAEYGGAARRMLDEAGFSGDPKLLSETARRYLHTEAGCKAMHLLGTSHLDHDRPLAAALCFQRLREIPQAARKWKTASGGSSSLALKTAVCWSRAGMPEHALRRLAELKQATPRGVIHLAGRDVALFEDESRALDWLVDVFGLPRDAKSRDVDDWPIVGGNASRTAGGQGGGPATEPLWTVSTSSWKVPVEEAPFSGGLIDVSRQIAGIESDFLEKGLPAIPGTMPLVVDGLVLARALGKLRAYDLIGGNLVWETPGDRALEDVRRGIVPPLSGDQGSILDPLLKQQVFTDWTYGTLSSDGRLVFCLEQLGFVSAGSRSSARNRQSHPLAATKFNRLDAYDLRSGKPKWKTAAASNGSDRETEKQFFLGPPLPLSRSLYCLADVNGEIRLLVLDSQTGDLQWMQSLESAAAGITTDPHRRQSGLSPSYAGGVLVCPTGSGSVVAVDLAMRTLMWRYRYRKYESGNPRRNRRAVMIAVAGRRVGTTSPEKPEGHWLDSVCAIAGNHVVLSPRDSQELHCLQLLDGTLLWKKPRGKRLYVETVSDDELLVVGQEQLEMLRLADGQPVWTRPTSMPGGRGLRTGRCYHLPLGTGEIATIDLDGGRTLSTLKREENDAPGNLVCSNGFIVSQGTDSLAVFQQSDPIHVGASRAEFQRDEDE